ncbi:MAG: UMP kinase [Ruthenibacterium sp.]
MKNKYQRVLIKLSGEALSGDKGFGLDVETIQKICAGIKQAHELGVEIAIVVGGGNFWRGRSSGEMERTRADQIGMLATAMNALAVADALEKFDIEVRVQTALTMQQIAEPYIRNRAIRHLEKGRVVILACGTGNPFFSTDTASALRAAEINADIIFKATMVDGVYNKDPKKHADAVKYDRLTFSRVLSDKLAVMDSTAATMCRDNNVPILVFDIMHPDNIAKAAKGEQIGTLVTEEEE